MCKANKILCVKSCTGLEADHLVKKDAKRGQLN